MRTKYLILKFDFPKIQLLDSSHHGLCDGTFGYDIKVKDGLPDGTIIPARVGIYFDDNAVVMTNEVDNIIGFPTGVTTPAALATKAKVYPNPAKNELNIKGLQDGTTYRLLNVEGTQMKTGTFAGKEGSISITTLAPGIYMLELTSTDGTRQMIRVVKE